MGSRTFRGSIFILGFLACLLCSSPLVASEGKGEQCSIASSAIHDASRIRKLRIKGPVPCFVHQKEQVKGYLLHAIDTKIPPAKLQMEALVYKTLGLIPEAFDYQNGIVELYLNQIGGYYDPEAKHFIMAGWLPAMLQTTIAVHELTHALQDQYFNLETFMDEKKFNGDELLARSALVEGDATAVMIDYTRQSMGQPGIESEQGVEAIMLQNVVGSSLMSGMNSVPQSMQHMLIFPYTSGLRFAHHVLKKGSYGALDTVFRRPPRSTEEILHPEKYFVESPDFEVIPAELLKPVSLPGAILKHEDVLGEFAISTLLAGYTSDKVRAAEAAAGWAGDRVAVFEDASAKKRFVIWETRWDTPKDAGQFAELYRQSLQQRFPAFSEGKVKSGNRLLAFEHKDKHARLIVDESL